MDTTPGQIENSLHSQILEHMAEGVYLIRASDGIIVYTSPVFDRMFGYYPGELIGSPANILNAHDPTSEAVINHMLYALQEHGSWSGELKNLKKDGSFLWCHANVSTLEHAEHGTVWISVHRDITQAKQTELILQQHHEFLEAFSQITLDLLKQRSLDDLLQKIVDVAAKILNAPYAEVMFKEGEELAVLAFTKNQPFLKGDRVGRNEGLLSWQAFDTGLPNIIDDYATWEKRRAIYDPISIHAVANFPIIAGQTSIGVFGLARATLNDPFTSNDIQKGVLFSQLAALVLENSKAYTTARESQQFMEQVMHAQPDMVYLYDLLEHRIVYANRHMGIALGYSPEEIAQASDDSPTRLVHPDDMERQMRDSARFYTAKDNEILESEYRFQHKDGSWRWLSLRNTIYARNPDGTPYRIMGIAQDITERKQTQLKEQEQGLFVSALYDTALALTSTLELDEVLQRILLNVHKVVPHDRASIMLIEGQSARILQCLGWSAQDVDEITKLYFPIVEVDHLNLMYHTRKPCMATDASELPGWLRLPNVATPSSYLAAPICLNDEVIGFINLDRMSADHFVPSQAERLQAFAAQAAIAIENARLFKKSHELAVLEERQQLARDLHDSITQTLFSAAVIAESTITQWHQNPNKIETELMELRDLTKGALAEMRTLLLELRPTAMEETDINDLLRQLTATLSGRSRIKAQLTIDGEALLPVEVTLAFFRIAREALNNVIKHARAQTVMIELIHENGSSTLRVNDDGRGFDTAKLHTGHVGLNTIQERADATAIRLAINSTIGTGTEVVASWQRG